MHPHEKRMRAQSACRAGSGDAWQLQALAWSWLMLAVSASAITIAQAILRRCRETVRRAGARGPAMT